MNKFQFITLLLLIFTSSCNKDQNRLTIHGKISNLEKPSIELSYILNDSVIVDTILTDDEGKFVYKTSVEDPSIITLYFNESFSSIEIFTEKNLHKVKIEGDALLSDVMQVSGGEINNDLSLFKKENEQTLKQRASLLFFENDKDTTIVNSHNIFSEKEREALINTINHELSQKVEDFIKKRTHRISSIILINEFLKPNENPKELERVLEYLTGEALDYPLTNKIKKYNSKTKLSAEGSHMPYFDLKNTKEKILRPNDFREKYLLLSFLSAEDEPSEDNIKILFNEYSNLDKKKIEFLSVFVDTDTFPIKQKVDTLPWNIIIDNKSWSSNIIKDYNVNSLPFNILIDPNGIILSRDIPIGDIKNIINKYTN